MTRYIDESKIKFTGETYTDDNKDVYIRLSDVRQAIAQTPAADVMEVKHSEWILYKDGSGCCKKCNYHQKLVWDYDSWQNFCGHCGAKMDGGVTDGS